MRILVVGGTGFVGPPILRRLIEVGHEVVCFHRGQTEADLPAEVVHIHGERERLVDHRTELARLAPEVVLDTRPMTEFQARILMSALAGITRRVIALSSGDVYRAYGLLHGGSCSDRSRLGSSSRPRDRLARRRGRRPH